MNRDASLQVALGVAGLIVHGWHQLCHGPPTLEDRDDLAGGFHLIEDCKAPGLEIGRIGGLHT